MLTFSVISEKFNETEKSSTLHVCSVWKKTFACKSSLKSHMAVHAEEKPYKCTLCDYSCVQSSDLKRHMYKHGGERPYKCDVCDYSCVHSGQLKSTRKNTS